MVRSMNHHKSALRRRRGQGLAEFALALPLLLLVLAGLLEVANLLLLYSRMEASTREAARFAALGGTDMGTREVFIQSAKESLELTPGVIEIWMTRAVLQYDEASQKYYWQGDQDGNTWGTSQEMCIYPETGCINQTSGTDPRQILGQISKSNANLAAANGDHFVVMSMYYEAKTVLNLPFFKVASGDHGRVPMRTYAVYRQEMAQTTVDMLAGGCNAYPIVLSMAVPGLNPSAYGAAHEGTALSLHRSTHEFDFLAWQRDHRTAADLDAALAYPGNSKDNAAGYINPFAPDQLSADNDRTLNESDYVAATEDGVSPTASTVQVFTKTDGNGFGRSMRVILSDGNPSTYAGGYSAYKIMGFAVIRIKNYDPSGVLEIEFVRFDRSCGESEKDK
jgi:hypothetical protein